MTKTIYLIVIFVVFLTSCAPVEGFVDSKNIEIRQSCVESHRKFLYFLPIKIGNVNHLIPQYETVCDKYQPYDIFFVGVKKSNGKIRRVMVTKELYNNIYIGSYIRLD